MKRNWFVILVGLGLSLAVAAEDDRRKVLIYSSGPISATEEALAAEIRGQHPEIDVEFQDIREHAKPLHRKFVQPILDTLERTVPTLVERFRARGRWEREQLSSPAHAKSPIPLSALVADMNRVQPDVVLFTSDEAANRFSTLRALGEFQEVPMAKFEAGSPRVDSALDRTFVLQPTEQTEYQRRGVPEHRVPLLSGSESGSGLEEVAKFVASGKSSWSPLAPTAGLSGGTMPTGQNRALRALGKEAGGKIELLYSYPMGPEKEGYKKGQLVIRQGSSVIVPGVGNLSLREYLYSTRSKGTFGESHGVAYQNTTLGLRLNTVPPELKLLVDQLKAGKVSEPYSQFKKAVESFRKMASTDGNLLGYDRIVTPMEMAELTKIEDLEERQQAHRERFRPNDPFQSMIDKRLRVDLGTEHVTFDNLTPATPLPASSPPKSLTKQEKALQAAHRTLDRNSWSPSAVRRETELFREGVSEADWDAIQRGETRGLDRRVRKAAERLERKVRDAATHWKTLSSVYDGYQQEKVPYLMDQTLARLEGEIARLGTRVKPRERASWLQKTQALQEMRKRYESQRELYGGPEDFRRAATARQFLQGAEDLASRIGSRFEGGIPKEKTKIRSWSAALKSLRQGLVTAGIGWIHPSHPGLVERVRQTAPALTGALGIKVDLQGKLPPPSVNPKEITLVVAHHGLGLMDLAGLGHNGAEWTRGAVLLAPEQYGLGSMGARLKKNPHLVVIGRQGQDAFERIEALIRNGQRTFLVLPDGGRKSGMYDIGPADKEWTSELIGKLHTGNWDVRLSNVTLPTNVTLGNAIDLPESQGQMRVQVDTPWENPELRFLSRVGGEASLADGIRAHWLSQLEGQAGPRGTLEKTEKAVQSHLRGFCAGAFTSISGG